jgi:hypothetical protein
MVDASKPGPNIHSVNSFDESATVTLKPVAARLQTGKITLTVEPKSMRVITIE